MRSQWTLHMKCPLLKQQDNGQTHQRWCILHGNMLDFHYHCLLTSTMKSLLFSAQKNSAKKTFRQWMYSHFINNSTTWRVKKYVPNLRGVVFSMFFPPLSYSLQSLHVEGCFSLPPWNSSSMVSNTFPFYEQNSPQKKNKMPLLSFVDLISRNFLFAIGPGGWWIPVNSSYAYAESIFLRRKFQVLWVKNSRGRCVIVTASCMEIALQNHHWGPKKLMKLDYIQ